MNIFDLIIKNKETVALSDVILDKENSASIRQLIKEHSYADELAKYGLPVNNKVLLYGSSGCGKTMTAKAIAGALGKNILILNLSNIVCSRIGETSQNIQQVFDKAAKEKAVLFLDEFDQIGKTRGNGVQDVEEMRRLVNTLIQLIDYFPSYALLICATNFPEIIDVALMRRFQLRIGYEMPPTEILDGYYDKLLAAMPEQYQDIPRKYDISFAEARDYAFTLVKSLLIEELEQNKKLQQHE
ncbi:AAA family ATPase [Pseudoflavitalea sp. G-6-1-2]|uniref:AAA family ATPase n=1 Tax=Pseudoflavitalea sp. G-6-1-2 TaxID=2728841 RepID=UPI00146CB3CB|nr:ATP-binding protein [Pseudoflavitalea sp. G-6-1-2]NML23541.1 AAA family ATPase [Pseudoflavitalea sp. G-6-1-2]